MNPAVIGYVPKGYPRVSETFVTNEIRALEQLGIEIEIFSLKRPVDARVQPNTRDVKAPLVYLPERILRALPRLLWVHASLLRRRPRPYGRSLAWTLRRCVRQRSTTTLRRFFQAGYLVEAVLRGRSIPHLHAHFCHGPATVTLFVKWLTGTPFSFTAHAKDLYLTPPDLLREKMREAEFVVTCTEANRAYMEKIGGDVTRVHRIYHGTDLTLFEGAGPHRSAGPPGLLSVGRLVPKKGFDTLLRACALLRDRGTAFRCEIVGEGPERAALEELRNALGLEDHVQLSGGMIQPELVSVYARADVFVLPCQIQNDGDRDGLPNVLVEAMAMQLPVVSTEVSGIPELVEPGVNGLLVPPRDPAALAAALQEILQDDVRRSRMGEAGRRRVLQDFDLARNSRSLAALFEARLQAEPRPAQPLVDSRDRRDRLDTLQAALDPEGMRSRLAAILSQSGTPGSLRSVHAEVLRRRKRRCVLRYEAVMESGGAQRSLGIIGKVFKAGAGEPVRARMEWLSARGFDAGAPDGISIPHVVAYVPALSLLLQEEIGGRAVKEYLLTPQAPWAVRRMAAALSKLHRTPPPLEKPWGLQEHLGRCHPPVTTLDATVPELRSLVREILSGATQRLREQGDIHCGLIHGDLHFGQVHVSPNRVWVIDLDASCVADPAADLGNALVFLQGKRDRIPQVDRLRDEFLDAYFAQMPAEILDRVPLYEALTHLRRACKQTRLQEKNWRKRTRRYLEASLACLQGLERDGWSAPVDRAG